MSCHNVPVLHVKQQICEAAEVGQLPSDEPFSAYGTFVSNITGIYFAILNFVVLAER
jgi:hypothetical protein